MKQKVRLQLTSDEGDRFFGIGVSELLHNVEKTGSLNQAAKQMGLSYNKACRMVNKTEQILGYHFVERTSGGKNGGGSVLTEEGRRFLEQFDQYNRKVQKESERLFQQIFIES